MSFVPLNDAVVTDSGSHITVMFSDRDRLTSQTKAALSLRLGRPVEFIFKFDNSTVTVREWWTNGKGYHPWGGPWKTVDSPSIHDEFVNDNTGKQGSLTRPAVIRQNYNGSYVEEWRTEDGLHRIGGPALIDIQFDPRTVKWYLEVENSPYSPFSELDTVRTMKQSVQQWYTNGICRNDDGYAMVIDTMIAESFIGTSALDYIKKTFYVEREFRWYGNNGKYHRLDGPAAISLSNVLITEKNGVQGKWKVHNWRGEWYYNGTSVKNLAVMQWAREHRVKLNQNPPIHTSSFKTEEDEVCFAIDLAAGKI